MLAKLEYFTAFFIPTASTASIRLSDSDKIDYVAKRSLKGMILNWNHKADYTSLIIKVDKTFRCPWTSKMKKIKVLVKNIDLESKIEQAGLTIIKGVDSAHRFKLLNCVDALSQSKVLNACAYVDVGLPEASKILVGKLGDKYVIEKTSPLAPGNLRDIRSTNAYVIKEFKPVKSRQSTPLEGDAGDLKKTASNEAKAEIEATEALQDVSGVIKVRGKLIDIETSEVMGFITERYDKDYKKYSEEEGSSQDFLKNFKSLVTTFEKMHEKDLVHNDIKLENVFIKLKDENISELVVGDIQLTNVTDRTFAYSSSYCFKEDHELIYDCPKEDVLNTRKQFDVRQFFFLMYYSICPEAFPQTPDSLEFNEAKTTFAPIPEGKATAALREYIYQNLTSKEMKDLPSMTGVLQKLNEI